MKREQFIDIINGFDIKIIEEYWLRVKTSDDLKCEFIQGYEDIEEDLSTLDDLQQRIDKAIEYIDHRDIEWGSYEHKVLLDILRGE